jgi:hypothetical protein
MTALAHETYSARGHLRVVGVERNLIFGTAAFLCEISIFNRQPAALLLSLLAYYTMSSDLFRKSVLNRLPAMPPTRAPWAEGDEDEDTLEELAEEEEGMSDISALPSQGSTR